MDPFDLGLLSVGIIIGMVVLGVRVAYASGIAGVIGLVWVRGYDAGAGLAGLLAHSEVSHVTLSVLPMFILIGFLAYYAGLTQSAFYAAGAGSAPCPAASRWRPCSRRRVSRPSPGPRRRPRRSSAASQSRKCSNTATTEASRRVSSPPAGRSPP